MVHHIENWAFLRDMMRCHPEIVYNGIFDILNRMAVGSDPQQISAMISRCGLAETKEGFEACLLLHREDVAREWRLSPGVLPEFETFMKELDESAGDDKRCWAEEHRL